MLTRRSLRTLLRLWAAMLIAVIGLQAGVPAAAPFQQTHGSAFSAATYEMALHRPAREQAQAPIVAMEPPHRALRVDDRPAVVGLVRPQPRPVSTGPPRPSVHADPAAPRAPPHS